LNKKKVEQADHRPTVFFLQAFMNDSKSFH